MRAIILSIFSALLLSCNNQENTVESTNDPISVSRISVTDTILTDTNWYNKYTLQYDKVCYESLEDPFLKKALEEYFVFDDDKVFSDYSCKENNCVSTHLKDYKAVLKTKPFDSTNKHLLYTNTSCLYAIDNKVFWGSDCDKPRIEIDSFKVFIKDRMLNIPNTEYQDLYNCENSELKKIHFSHGINDYVILLMDASDGAGAYTVVWIIKDGKYIRRVVDSAC